MSDRKQTARSADGLPNNRLWGIKWLVIIALLVLLLLFIVPRGASAWTGATGFNAQEATARCRDSLDRVHRQGETLTLRLAL